MRGTFNSDGQGVEDLTSEVVMNLVRALRQCKSAPREKPIASLRSYVAVMAYNASDNHLRRKYPRRFSLKNRIKYILTHQPGLALWESESKSVLCGFDGWRRSKKTRSLQPDRDGPDLNEFLQKRAAGQALDQTNPADLVSAVLDFAAAPVEIDELVTTIAEILKIRDEAPHVPDEYSQQSELSFDPRDTLDKSLDHRAKLVKVWSGILELPLRQRSALLLNLRDEQGGPAIALLPILRISSIEQIAEILNMPAGELAEIWNNLPLEDAAIAERLGATRQQVINLRKCARERLARRLQASG
jgi:hypothetical protein